MFISLSALLGNLNFTDSGVSKTTISKAISALGLSNRLNRSGNKYIISEDQTEQIKMQIANSKPQTASDKSQLENQIALIELLQKQLALLNEQLSIKDGQIKAYQEQIRILTDSLHDATVALTAEQALHAGTIQRQLTEQINSKEEAALDQAPYSKFFQHSFFIKAEISFISLLS